MILLDSKCMMCTRNIKVNHYEWRDMFCHLCPPCMVKLSEPAAAADPDAEFEPETEEELEMCNSDLYHEDLPGLNMPSCDCGAAKIGSAYHSHWCSLSHYEIETTENEDI